MGDSIPGSPLQAPLDAIQIADSGEIRGAHRQGVIRHVGVDAGNHFSLVEVDELCRARTHCIQMHGRHAEQCVEQGGIGLSKLEP